MERLLATEIKVSKLEDGKDSREAYMWSKVVTMGNIVEVTTMEKTPMPPPTQKINKDLYFDKRTGDVFGISTATLELITKKVCARRLPESAL